MLNRYSDINYVMASDIEDGIEIIRTAYEKRDEERLWQQWLVERPYMDPFISFENYKKKAIKKVKTGNNSRVDVKEIIADAEEIKKLDQGRR